VAVFRQNIASCDFCLAGIRPLVLTRPSWPGVRGWRQNTVAVFRQNIASCDFCLAGIRPLVLTRPSWPGVRGWRQNTVAVFRQNIASCDFCLAGIRPLVRPGHPGPACGDGGKTPRRCSGKTSHPAIFALRASARWC
jgi:hypothetical protein